VADLEGGPEEPHVLMRQVRAKHDDDTLVVYQAYAPAIAEPALKAQMFVPPFKRERMTWIKPSFNWMMYRCGWGSKPGQERVLAITITRAGFNWALEHSTLSHERNPTSPVRVQWDPERDVALQRLDDRAIQVGLSGEAVHAYVDEWIQGIEDVTPLAREIAGLVKSGDLASASRLVPEERPLRLSEAAAAAVGADG
jgi:hypothetical protein